jgi:uncharacterized protein (DUF58 family)
LIYPTRLAVVAAAAGAPLSFLVAAAAPQYWYAGAGWALAVILLTALDAFLAPAAAALAIDAPAFAYVGETRALTLRIDIAGARRPSFAEVAVATDGLVRAEGDGRVAVALEHGSGTAQLPLFMARRGLADVEEATLRWLGPLRLVWRQRRERPQVSFPILPDIRPVRDRGAQIFQRQALQGLLAQMNRGEGTDFDALVEYRSGMDRRAIDWKQSARHIKLHAKEYRTERNAQVVFALDSGRQMTEPVADVPRIDRAVSAALLNAWVALKLGDRVALHSFDSAPRVATGLVSGTGSFVELQRRAAAIDYSGAETNYTYALTTLAARLTRRSLIVIFTEFTDLTSADFLVRAARRLVETHLLLVVVLRDEELESIAAARPETAADVTRAVTAAALLRDRKLALLRLRHLGVHLIESEHDRVGESLVAGYIDLKRRNLL